MKMRRITIRRSPSADTRSADHMVTRTELRESTFLHVMDVHGAMHRLAMLIEEAGIRHDWTKKEHFDEFYQQFHRAQETGEWGHGWYDRIHIVKERHHLRDRCPDDVNLIDVLEMLCDNVMAGLARSGEYREEIPDTEMLLRAYRNTARLLVENTEVVE